MLTVHIKKTLGIDFVKAENMPKEFPLVSWGNSWKGLAAKGSEPGAPSDLEEKWIITDRETREWITALVTVHLCSVWAYFFINISRDSNYRILMILLFLPLGKIYKVGI